MEDPSKQAGDDQSGPLTDIYQSISFLAGFIVVLVIGTILYSFWGDEIHKWPDKEPVARKYHPVVSAQAILTSGSTDELTGLIVAPGFEVVRGTCTACHSAQLVTQNRASREGWEHMIRWMQEKQGLWDLGEQEGTILDYLAAHYAPDEIGRRANLPEEEIEWYPLDQ